MDAGHTREARQIRLRYDPADRRIRRRSETDGEFHFTRAQEDDRKVCGTRKCMKTLSNEETKAELLKTLAALRPDSTRRGGRMSPHQMVCHLSDSFRTIMGLKSASTTGNIFH